MKKRKILITVVLILLVFVTLTFVFLHLPIHYDMYSQDSVYFDEFDLYKEQLHKIAERGLEKYCTDNENARVYINFGSGQTSGFTSGTHKNIMVDAELSSMLLTLKESNIPCHLDYIIIGDTYVTFTREGCTFAIMYSEDNVEPKGVWKYEDDDMQIDKFEDCWYELKAHGLGVIP